MHEVTLADLRVHSSVIPANGAAPPKACVVLLHGYGAPGTDLLTLADSLRVPPGTAFLFPEGPIDLAAQFGPGYEQARAWWPIDMVRMQVAMMTGTAENALSHMSSGVEEASGHCVRLLDEIESKFGLTSDRIVLGGFSQGSTISLEIALRDDRPLAGLLLMSPTMLDPSHVQRAAPLRGGTRALVSHGQVDPILPYSISESLVQHLRAAQWEVQWVPFGGGHGIPQQVLSAASDLLPKWLA